jgi:hypothetical protein
MANTNALSYIRQSFAAVTVTLTTHGTVYNLKALVDAIYANSYVQTPGSVMHLNIQADPSNTDTVLLGDSKLSSTNYGMDLPPRLDVTGGTAQGNTLEITSHLSNIPFQQFYAMCANTDNQKVNIIIFAA